MKPRISNNSGMALVLTLLVVAILTAMVVEFAYGVYVGTSALHNWQTSQKLSVAARSAVKLGTKLIAQSNSQHPSYTYPGSFEISQKIPFEDIDGTITIRIEDENGKFNLNGLRSLLSGMDPDKVPYKSFLRLLSPQALNFQPDAAADIADRISYWENANSEHRPGGKSATKDAFLDSVDELMVIPGVDREKFERLRPYVTIYSGNAVNINSASVPVLMSVSDHISKDMAERIIQYRESVRPFESVSDLQHVEGFDSATIFSLGSYMATHASAYKVTVTAESNGIKRIVECVLDSGGNVKYWKEL